MVSHDKWVCLLDYLPYAPNPFLKLNRDDFWVPASMSSSLKLLKISGYKLRTNYQRPPGLDVVDRNDQTAARVQVKLNPHWQVELIEDLQKLAARIYAT